MSHLTLSLLTLINHLEKVAILGLVTMILVIVAVVLSNTLGQAKSHRSISNNHLRSYNR